MLVIRCKNRREKALPCLKFRMPQDAADLHEGERRNVCICQTSRTYYELTALWSQIHLVMGPTDKKDRSAEQEESENKRLNSKLKSRDDAWKLRIMTALYSRTNTTSISSLLRNQSA